MTVTPQITVSDGRLAVRGRTVLTGVPDNISAAHASGAGPSSAPPPARPRATTSSPLARSGGQGSADRAGHARGLHPRRHRPLRHHHPRFLIIDDGWQQIGSENTTKDVAVQEGAQFASRLTGIKENAMAGYPVQSPGVMGNQPDIVMDSLSVLGLGLVLVHPRRRAPRLPGRLRRQGRRAEHHRDARRVKGADRPSSVFAACSRSGT